MHVAVRYSAIFILTNICEISENHDNCYFCAINSYIILLQTKLAVLMKCWEVG